MLGEKKGSSSFHFEISGNLEDFAAFCAIIRGGTGVDEKVIEALTDKLKNSTDKLKAAEEAAGPFPQ